VNTSLPNNNTAEPNMKKVVLLVLMALLCASVLLAQEEPIPPKRSRMAKVGLFVGFTPGWLNVDVAPVNAFITAANGAPLSTSGMVMYGGAGAIYIIVLPNVRIGGAGMSGSLKSAVLDNDLRRDAKLNVGYGGVTIEYVIPIAERLDVSAGALLGWGGMDLTMRVNNGSTNTWENEQTLLKGNLVAPGNNLTRTYTGKFFIYVPSINVEYAILGWLGTRLGVSYIGMAFPSWQVDANYDLLNVPNNVKGSGFMIQAGFFVGTF
jgi:hypothetical protein